MSLILNKIYNRNVLTRGVPGGATLVRENPVLYHPAGCVPRQGGRSPDAPEVARHIAQRSLGRDVGKDYGERWERSRPTAGCGTAPSRTSAVIIRGAVSRCAPRVRVFIGWWTRLKNKHHVLLQGEWGPKTTQNLGSLTHPYGVFPGTTLKPKLISRGPRGVPPQRGGVRVFSMRYLKKKNRRFAAKSNLKSIDLKALWRRQAPQKKGAPFSTLSHRFSSI